MEGFFAYVGRNGAAGVLRGREAGPAPPVPEYPLIDPRGEDSDEKVLGGEGVVLQRSGGGLSSVGDRGWVSAAVILPRFAGSIS